MFCLVSSFMGFAQQVFGLSLSECSKSGYYLICTVTEKSTFTTTEKVYNLSFYVKIWYVLQAIAVNVWILKQDQTKQGDIPECMFINVTYKDHLHYLSVFTLRVTQTHSVLLRTGSVVDFN